jgi:hypothetical protein
VLENNIEGDLLIQFFNIKNINSQNNFYSHSEKVMPFMNFPSITLKVRVSLCSDCTQHQWACVFKINSSALFSLLPSSSGYLQKKRKCVVT